MKLSKPYSVHKKTGFTLVELIIVIILISILSISAFSRFSGTSGFAEYTYQARLISALRNMQTRAMHDNRDGYCFKVNFDTSTTPAFGPPQLSYTSGTIADTCSNSINFGNVDYLTTSTTEMSDEGVSLCTISSDSVCTLSSFSYIDFDDLGRPTNDDTNCATTCKVTFTGEASVSVCIESEGYIHAC